MSVSGIDMLMEDEEAQARAAASAKLRRDYEAAIIAERAAMDAFAVARAEYLAADEKATLAADAAKAAETRLKEARQRFEDSVR